MANTGISLKGQSNDIFDLQFFSSFEPALATDQWVKIFLNLVKNSQSNSNFKSENWTPGGIVPWRVRLPGVSYHSKSISPGYHTPASQSPRVIIPRRVNLPRVSYPGESIKNPPTHDSLGYDTPASQSPRCIIPRRVTFFDTKDLISQRNLN